MTHVFISYSHKDFEQRNSLIEYLTQAEFKLWYDERLEGGDDWRDEITTAIDEAYAILLVVTENAMNSHYCTYEWAYALGTGAPVIPLIFEDISVVKIHAPLRSRQFINCVDGIPQTLGQRLLTFRQEPIDVIYLKRKIMDAIMPFSIFINTLLWLGKVPTLSTSRQKRFSHALAMRARDEAAKLHFDVLPELMTDKSHAFTSKLKRSTRSLIDGLQETYELLHATLSDPYVNLGHEMINQQLKQHYQEHLQDAVVHTVESSELFSKYIEYLETTLTNKPDPFNDMDIHFLLGLYLDDKDQDTVITLIGKVTNHLYPKNAIE